jgi:predicted kinase
VRARALRGDDPSDAGPELVAASRARFEPLDDWPSAERVELRTDGPLRPEQSAAILARMGLAVGSPQRS